MMAHLIGINLIIGRSARKAFREIRSVLTVEGSRAVFDVHLNAPAVELDFVQRE